MVRLVERIALPPGRPERVHRERIGRNGTGRRGKQGPARAIVFVHQPHLDFVGADAHAVAVAQAAQVAGADGIVFAVEKSAVGRGVGELP